MNIEAVKLLRTVDSSGHSWYLREYIVKNATTTESKVDSKQCVFSGCCNINSKCFEKLPSLEQRSKLSKQEVVSYIVSQTYNNKISLWVKTGRTNAQNFRKSKRNFQITDVKEILPSCCGGFGAHTAVGKVSHGVCTIFAEMFEGNQAQCETRIRNHLESVLLHATYLLAESPQKLPSRDEPVFFDVIYLGKEEFNMLVYKFVGVSLTMSRDKRSKDFIAEEIMLDSKMAVVSLFFSRYLLLQDRNENLVWKLPSDIEEVIRDIRRAGTPRSKNIQATITILKDTWWSAFQDEVSLGLIFNRYTGLTEMIEIALEKTGTLTKFIQGLTKQYDMLVKERKEGVDSFRLAELKDAIFSNPVYRQIVVTLDF